jgi:hypothetical protein
MDLPSQELDQEEIDFGWRGTVSEERTLFRQIICQKEEQ